MPGIFLLLSALAALALASCGGAASSSAPGRQLPSNPTALAALLERRQAGLHALADDWRRSGALRPPAGLTARARIQQEAIVELAHTPKLAAAAASLLRPQLQRTTLKLSAALRELDRLGRGEASAPPRLREPPPLPALLSYYRQAERRFGVGWTVLAAVNMVESAFARVRSPSSAGARGPMQFLPATWHEYGLGGNVEDPRDAILGAANYLAASGAPADYFEALERYNPSPLYAHAVLEIAAALRGDPDLVYALYLWRP